MGYRDICICLTESAQVAINRIHTVYGSNISITELIKKITIDGGDHPNLR
jgi:hypothetical protein